MSALARQAHTEPRPQPRLAALPMYDLPELAQANDALWSAIAGRLEALGVDDVPADLERLGDLDTLWNAPSLLLAQTCGYPLMTHLAGRVRLVATPRYRAPGCDGPFHRAAVVVRASDPAGGLPDMRGRRCAINDWESDTGMNLLRAEIAVLARGEPFFGSVEATGSHAASAQAVVDGQADVASIDAVTLDHLRRFRPRVAAGLRVLHWTVRSPGLPLITAVDTDPATHARLLLALDSVIQAPALRETRNDLRLEGFNVLPLSHYRAVLYLEQIATAQGYPVLA